jgi:hypothetical protein
LAGCDVTGRVGAFDSCRALRCNVDSERRSTETGDLACALNLRTDIPAGLGLNEVPTLR